MSGQEKQPEKRQTSSGCQKESHFGRTSIIQTNEKINLIVREKNHQSCESLEIDHETQKRKLISSLLEQGRISINEARILTGLRPIQTQYDGLLKKE
ncbi:hypothetical protein [Bacillus sp. Hm123]|uniref:hypothetical protein n=1 Tax=Bacillus sp. Hm123 TaxID=3450745 RepID=UPI003F435ACD